VQTCTVLIVAGGRGARFGGSLPKQYALFEGESVLRRSVMAFRGAPGIDHLQVVIGADDEARYRTAVGDLDLPPPVRGGASRQHSVLNGLEALAGSPPDLVAVHDAARPFVRPADIAACLAALADPEVDGAVLGVPLADTLKRADDGGVISGTVPRPLLEAHRAAATLAASEGTALTDDAAVAERAGLRVVMVRGHEDNRKITTADDLPPTTAMETRTAFGFDVHGFGPGDSVTLGGIVIAHARGLVGHSDADVALHALTDAVLGTIGAGDIGMHFPPSDPQWRGVSSDRFLRHAVDLLQAAGGRIVHLDLTLICEAPRIGPHRQAMVDAIARITGVEPGRVSVKATTTEGLGFTGRREGIAAQAVATIEMPRAPT